MSGIRIKQVNKIYDNGFQAVHNLNLEIYDGEFMVLVGPSGCGKTTTLRMIAGLEDISSGDVLIGDRRINNVEPKDRDIAMVFQNYALYPHMTIYENMAYGLKLRGISKKEIEKRVRESASVLGLDQQLSKRPKQLSGGQRQRVALGRAIVRKPAVFLFDEPLSNLDAKLRGDMRFELKALQQKLRTTAVYVTHDQIEAMTLGDRITVINQGKIQQVADPTTLYDYPVNRFVASFIGSPPMNFFEGVLDDKGNDFIIDNGNKLSLSMKNKDKLFGVAGSRVSMGIRPEHLKDMRYNENVKGPVISLLVKVVEVLGDHQYIYLEDESNKDSTIIMKNSSSFTTKVDKKIDICLDTRYAHIFAGTDDNAQNITLSSGKVNLPDSYSD